MGKRASIERQSFCVQPGRDLTPQKADSRVQVENEPTARNAEGSSLGINLTTSSLDLGGSGTSAGPGVRPPAPSG